MKSRVYARDRFVAELNAFRTVAAPPETETSVRGGRDWEPHTGPRRCRAVRTVCVWETSQRGNDLTAGAVQFKTNPPSRAEPVLHSSASAPRQLNPLPAAAVEWNATGGKEIARNSSLPPTVLIPADPSAPLPPEHHSHPCPRGSALPRCCLRARPTHWDWVKWATWSRAPRR